MPTCAHCHGSFDRTPDYHRQRFTLLTYSAVPDEGDGFEDELCSAACLYAFAWKIRNAVYTLRPSAPCFPPVPPLRTDNALSAQPCGCDPGALWVCAFHSRPVR